MRHIQLGVLIGAMGLMATACAETGGPLAPSAALSGPDPVLRSEPAPEPADRNFEMNFLTAMIDHHQMAVDMAEACLAEDVPDALHAMCQEMAATQMAEIELMQGWLLEWYDVDYSPTMKPADMKRMERLTGLEGDAFAIAFMESMVRHHGGAVREGEKCLRRAYHPDLHALCEDIIAAQTAEIAIMQTWLCDWYDRCRTAAA